MRLLPRQRQQPQWQQRRDSPFNSIDAWWWEKCDAIDSFAAKNNTEPFFACNLEAAEYSFTCKKSFQLCNWEKYTRREWGVGGKNILVLWTVWSDCFTTLHVSKNEQRNCKQNNAKKYMVMTKKEKRFMHKFLITFLRVPYIGYQLRPWKKKVNFFHFW